MSAFHRTLFAVGLVTCASAASPPAGARTNLRPADSIGGQRPAETPAGPAVGCLRPVGRTYFGEPAATPHLDASSSVRQDELLIRCK
jgi:hypothetical protein